MTLCIYMTRRKIRDVHQNVNSSFLWVMEFEVIF